MTYGEVRRLYASLKGKFPSVDVLAAGFGDSPSDDEQLTVEHAASLEDELRARRIHIGVGRVIEKQDRGSHA